MKQCKVLRGLQVENMPVFSDGLNALPHTWHPCDAQALLPPRSRGASAETVTHWPHLRPADQVRPHRHD